MTAGFQAFTDTGLVQIDGMTQNYALRQTLSVSTSAGAFPMGRSDAGVQYTAQGNVAAFTVPAVAPLVVLYSPSTYATVLKVTKGSGVWTILIWSNQAAAIAVYIFDQASAAAPSGAGFGLQVFDASGTLVADARQRLGKR